MTSGLTPSFFIVGADRSGTTLLRLMLNNHERLSVGPETWFFLELIKQFDLRAVLSPADLERAIAIIINHQRFAEYPVTEESLRAEAARLDRPTIGSLFAVLPGLVAAREGKTCFGDKTPGYSMCVIELAEAYPEAKFIHIVRDARDVALSLVRVGWHGGKPWRAAEHWMQRVGACEQARATLGPERMMLVRYADLVLDAEVTLRSICGFLDVSFDERMLTFHETSGEQVLASEKSFHSKTRRPPSPSDVDVWRRDASRMHLLWVEGGAGSLMRSVGQELACRGSWRVIARACWLAAMVRMRILYPLRRRLIARSGVDEPADTDATDATDRVEPSDTRAEPMNGAA
ncbi:MAG: sulfotransferase [Phycisphaerales bacterium]|nr:sulfotransferase [Phycisphaerales bacterium]